MDILGPNISYDTLFLKDNRHLAIIEKKDIESITYSSKDRKCIFNLTNGKKYGFRRKFGDMVGLLEVDKNFIKIERGTIVNTTEIRAIYYKEGYILFKSQNKLHLNKNKLKQIEEKIFYASTAFYL